MKFSLYPTKTHKEERQALGLPPQQAPRSGATSIKEAGIAWENSQLDQLAAAAQGRVRGSRSFGTEGLTGFKEVPLESLLDLDVKAGDFLVQTGLRMEGSFSRIFGLDVLKQQSKLTLSGIIPDLLMVLPAGTSASRMRPDGKVEALAVEDERLQLRVVDIKMIAEPNSGYFAEVSFYAMVLAGWLEDRPAYAQRFVVTSDSAIWPGKAMLKGKPGQRELTSKQVLAELDQDLVTVPASIFAQRVRRFLMEELPQVIEQDWRDLPFHVDGRCSGCPYLGAHWLEKNEDGRLVPTEHRDHCMPTAQATGHLSQVAYISRGARSMLESAGISTVADLCALDPEHEVLDSHQALRTARTILAPRAAVLGESMARIPDDVGTSAIMPKWANLRIYLQVGFDNSTTLGVSLGVQASWSSILPFASEDEREKLNWPSQVFVVMEKDAAVERIEFMAFLAHLHAILFDPRIADADIRLGKGSTKSQEKKSSVQVYLWDNASHEHLCRMVGRHLPAILADRGLSSLAWLFPSADLMSNPDAASRMTPVTVVQDVVRSILAAPVAHHYTLLNVARCYYPDYENPEFMEFKASGLYEDPLGDNIPGGRIHDLWSEPDHRKRNLQADSIQIIAKTRLRALATVVRRLESDLHGRLSDTAPRICDIGRPVREEGMGQDSEMWLTFTRLNQAMARLEVDTVRAMPVHEREARFKGARLRRVLADCGAFEMDAEDDMLREMGLEPKDGRRVYRLMKGSLGINAKEDDFKWSLAPVGVTNFLSQSFPSVVHNAKGNKKGRVNRTIEVEPPQFRWLMENATSVTVVHIDREKGLVVLDETRMRPGILDDVEQVLGFDLSQEVTLDPTHLDFFTRKLRSVLLKVGMPEIARRHCHIEYDPVRGLVEKVSRHTPLADVLWGAGQPQPRQDCDLPG